MMRILPTRSGLRGRARLSPPCDTVDLDEATQLLIIRDAEQRLGRGLSLDEGLTVLANVRRQLQERKEAPQDRDFRRAAFLWAIRGLLLGLTLIFVGWPILGGFVFMAVGIAFPALILLGWKVLRHSPPEAQAQDGADQPERSESGA